MDHPNKEELERIEELAALVREQRASCGELIELALLYFNPGARGDEGAKLLETVLQLEPANPIARLWFAYLSIYELLVDESVRRGIDLMRDMVTSDQHWAGAAGVVLYGGLNSLRSVPRGELIGVLKSSVACEPNWVSNRFYLGEQLAQEKRFGEALEHVRRARQNFLPRDWNGSHGDRLVEVYITGRLGFGYVFQALERLEAKIVKEHTDCH